MKDFKLEYSNWYNEENLDVELKEELISVKDNDEEIKDRFYQDLSFGTAGLRGKLGAGTNRMNRYVVGRATKALGQVILEDNPENTEKGVAIAHDCRIKSPEFALECGLVLASMGIKVYLFDSLRPTPELSYAVRYYNCAAGINITASHNPKDYNGYKVYWKEGSQIKSDIADKVLENISHLDLFEGFKSLSEQEAKDKGLLVNVGEEVDESFYKATMELSLRDEEVDKDIKIVYTPLNGAGNIPVRTVLERMGYKNVAIVKEQENPDGTFPTVDYPNPEDTAAFEYAEKLAKEIRADILIATDPDCDRLAVEVVHQGEIQALNGNQTGVILINYILEAMKEKNTLPANGAMVKSIVTGEMGAAIAKTYGVKMFNVLTGFKNICELPNIWDTTKEYKYIFGYEESIGYNVGDHLRDKDGVAATLLLAEAAGYYKKKGLTLIDVLNSLFETYGYYQESTTSIVLEGIEGQERIKRMMVAYRDKYAKAIGEAAIDTVTDYLNSTVFDVGENKTSRIDIEKTDAVKFYYDDGCWYALRPSGTEPKIKLYVYTKANTMESAKAKLKEIETTVTSLLMSIE